MEGALTFTFEGIDAQNMNVMGTLTSFSEMDAIRQLERQGIRVERIAEKKDKIKLKARKIRLDHLAVFSRQLATMVSAGMPLLQCLYALEEQTENKIFRLALKDIIKKIEQGECLSDAFAAYPFIFSPLYTNMVKAGEASGMFSDILERLAEFMEQSYALSKKIKSAMMYPCVVTFMATLISIFLLVKVIPMFETIYADFGSKLPLITRMLIGVSGIIRDYFYLCFGSVILGYMGIKRLLLTSAGQACYDKTIFQVPIIGVLAKKIIMLRFAKTLSVLIKSGVPILQSLHIVSETVNNGVIKSAILETRDRVKEGESISVTLSNNKKIFPPMVVRMIAVGEKTGKLDTMLNKISEFYQQEVDAAIAGLTSLIEPLLIAFLGVIIGTIVISVFLPIFKMSTIINA